MHFQTSKHLLYVNKAGITAMHRMLKKPTFDENSTGIYLGIVAICLILLPTGCTQFLGPPIRNTNYLIQEDIVCRTPLNERGLCVSLKECPEVLEIFKRVPRYQATAYSQELNRLCAKRNTLDNYPLVCCTHAVSQSRSLTPTIVPDTTVKTTPKPEVLQTTERNEGEPCTDPNSNRGFCKPLSDCSEILVPLQKNPSNQTIRSFIHASHNKCGFSSTDVCCTETGPTRTTKKVKTNLFPNEENGCGVTRQSISKIVGGEDSELGSWPWAALLGYGIRSVKTFKCGGTLITAKHVLTAAHCLDNSLSFVRLGEFDLSTDNETAHLDVPIERSIGHPEFLANSDKRHDIAVLYLEHSVQFTHLILPICLPSADLRSKSYVGYHPFVAGWGKKQLNDFDGANILQQVQIEVFDNSVCRNVYKLRNKFARDSHFDDTVLCAGNLLGGKDSCRGDSGGPLMMPEYYKGNNIHYYLIGVVSYGIGCGNVGIPGVYSSVQHFMKWIEQRVDESQP